MFGIKHVIEFCDKERDYYHVEATKEEAASYIERMATDLTKGAEIISVTTNEVDDRLLCGSIYTMNNGDRIRIGLRAARGTRYAGNRVNDRNQVVGASLWWYCDGTSHDSPHDKTLDLNLK
jgi:hypothetical protein